LLSLVTFLVSLNCGKISLDRGFLVQYLYTAQYPSIGPLKLEEKGVVVKSSLRLESRELEFGETNPKSSDVYPALFFNFYSKVAAFNTALKKPDEAVIRFFSSKEDLERKLDRYRRAQDICENMAICHSLLALIHWLYPNHRGYDRLKNATEMYEHAVDATSSSEYSLSETFVIGLFIQLRVLPFLIRSGRPLTENMTKARRLAIWLLSILESPFSGSYVDETNRTPELHHLKPEQIDGFRGILLDGLGFSYWQLERNVEVSLEYLQISVNSLLEVDKRISKKGGRGARRRSPSGFKESKTRNRFKIPNTDNDLTDSMRNFYHAMTSQAFWDLGHSFEGLADKSEGEEMIRLNRRARANYERSYSFAKRTTLDNYKGLGAYMIAATYETETQFETEKRKIRSLLKKAVMIGDEALDWLSLWSTYESDFLGGSWIAACYARLADYSNPKLRQKYMRHSLMLARKAEELLAEDESNVGGKLFGTIQIGDTFFRISDHYKRLATSQRSELVSPMDSPTREKTLVIEPLKKSLEYALKSKVYFSEEKEREGKKSIEARLLAADSCYELSSCNISEGERKTYFDLGKKMCNEALAISRKNQWNESIAESNWLLAQIMDLEGNYNESANRYLEAYESYEKSRAESGHGINLYQSFAKYMLAWNRIELAKIAHVSSRFEKAASLYSEASRLISETKDWSKGSRLFLAESLIERAEAKSFEGESVRESINLFDHAVTNLSKFYEEAKKDSASYLPAFSALAQQLIIFCRARMKLEDSKEAYRIGDIERSISGLSNAEAMFNDLALNPIISDPVRSNELQSMASLCKALISFQKAQIRNDPELYLEARKIFGRASEESKSKTLQPLLAGLASFASFLFYSNQVEKSLDSKLDIDLVRECNKALQIADSNFKKLGNKSFLNILKASKQILDASIKMSSADREVEDIEMKAKLYAEAHRSLTQASRYYKLVGSSRRLEEALKMISAVRNRQSLIPIAHDIIAEIASNQIIYAAIASSSMIEQAPHTSSRGISSTYVSLDCEITKQYTEIGVVSKISFTLSNLGRDPITAVKIEGTVPEEFEILDSQLGVADRHSLKLNRQIAPGTTTHFTLSYRPSQAGEFSWHPALIYLDPSRNFRVAKSQIVRSVVENRKTHDFEGLLKLKTDLDSQFEIIKRKLANANDVDHERLTNEMYTVKEKISRIDEEFLRTKHEYDQMSEELKKIQLDIESLESRKTQGAENSEEIANLKAEEKLLQSRIDRRRLLLQQAQLL
jgi:hypothetical protein